MNNDPTTHTLHDRGSTPADKKAVEHAKAFQRQERLAAGWQECWGVYDWDDGQWRGDDPSKWGGHRQDFGFARAACREAADYSIGSCAARRFWRRKKPKAPPPLAVGDEVAIVGEVRSVHSGGVSVRVPSGVQFWVNNSDVRERVERP